MAAKKAPEMIRSLKRYLLRFKRPVAEFNSSGCLDNSCGETIDLDGCKCNSFHSERRKWQQLGYTDVIARIVKLTTIKIIRSNGTDVVIEYYKMGR